MEILLLQFFSALVGGLIVYVFGIRKLSIELQNSFIQKQMAEFYSPIAGYRKRILGQSEVRGKISGMANEAWQELCAQHTVTNQLMLNSDELYVPYGKIIDYDNKQLREELMPLYRKMLDLFTEKYWLADADSRAYYQNFLEYVEIWERCLVDAMPREVLRKIEHSEEKILPFYEHIELRLFELQEKIKTKSFLKLEL